MKTIQNQVLAGQLPVLNGLLLDRMSHRQREQVKVKHAQCQVRADHPLVMVDLFCDGQAGLCVFQRVRIRAS